MGLPTLAAVPPSHHDLTVKTTSSGITYLREGRFRSRYTGNKFSAVDINGNLWLKSSELKKHIAIPGEGKRHKKARVETQAVKILSENGIQTYDNLSTVSGSLLTTLPELLTEKSVPKVREYRVHKREVRQRILGYANTFRGKKELYFWTVTFPKGTTDDMGYRLFNIWLTKLRQYKMLKEYIWIAERQENGTVHFHIAIPHKMPVKRANAMMAGTLKTFAKRGEIPFSVYQCNRYNGVDISKNRKTKRVTNFAIKKGAAALIGYLTKYITKNEGVFSHLAWHNSRGYSSLFTGVTFTATEFVKYGFHLQIDRRKAFKNEYFIFVPWAGDPPTLITEHLFKLNSYLQNALQ